MLLAKEKIDKCKPNVTRFLAKKFFYGDSLTLVTSQRLMRDPKVSDGSRQSVI